MHYFHQLARAECVSGLTMNELVQNLKTTYDRTYNDQQQTNQLMHKSKTRQHAERQRATQTRITRTPRFNSRQTTQRCFTVIAER